jgi:hypothetical protein
MRRERKLLDKRGGEEGARAPEPEARVDGNEAVLGAERGEEAAHDDVRGGLVLLEKEIAVLHVMGRDRRGVVVGRALVVETHHKRRVHLDEAVAHEGRDVRGCRGDEARRRWNVRGGA